MGNEEGVTMGVRAVMKVVISNEGGDRLRKGKGRSPW